MRNQIQRGLATQLIVAIVILKTERGHRLFQDLGDGFNTLMNFVLKIIRLPSHLLFL